MGAACSAHVKDKSLSTPWRHTGEAEIQLHSFINFGTRWRRVVNLTTRMLYPGIHWVGSWVGPRARPNVLQKKKTLAPTGIPTELSRLLKEKKFIQNCSSKIWKDVRHEYNIKTECDMTWSGFIWHKIESNYWLMWKCYWSVRCNKTMEMWLDKRLPAYKKSIILEVRNTKRSKARTV